MSAATGTPHPPPEPRYTTWPDGSACCLDCGALVGIESAHTRFHSILSGHAWALAVFKTAHLGPATHDRYDVAVKLDRRRFDSWTNDALAEVAGAADGDAGA